VRVNPARTHLVWLVFWPLVCALACVPADPPGGPKRKSRASVLGSSSSGERERPAGRARAPAARGEVDAAVLLTPFQDDFERATLGPDYRPTSGVWHVRDGRLCGQGARNRPVWLVPRLPRNARIEFEAASDSPDGDIKVEAWGDGRSRATGVSYADATSYLFVFGGWKNTLHVLARLDEHGDDRREVRLDPESDDPRTQTVEPGRTYHFRLERRDGKTVRFHVDDIEILTLVDPEPLTGAGHEHFAFNGWETPVCFDNLDILPLD